MRLLGGGRRATVSEAATPTHTGTACTDVCADAPETASTADGQRLASPGWPVAPPRAPLPRSPIPVPHHPCPNRCRPARCATSSARFPTDSRRPDSFAGARVDLQLPHLQPREGVGAVPTGMAEAESRATVRFAHCVAERSASTSPVKRSGTGVALEAVVRLFGPIIVPPELLRSSLKYHIPKQPSICHQTASRKQESSSSHWLSGSRQRYIRPIPSLQ
jgi:hypothetical protein